MADLGCFSGTKSITQRQRFEGNIPGQTLGSPGELRCVFISAMQLKTETDAPFYDTVLELCEVTNHL